MIDVELRLPALFYFYIHLSEKDIARLLRISEQEVIKRIDKARDDLYDLILSKRCLEYTSTHIACMTIGPKMRNLNRDSKNAKDRYIVCLRWNFIKEDIINYKNSLR